MFQTWLRYAHAGRDRFDTGSRTDRWEEAPLSALASDATGTQFHPRCADAAWQFARERLLFGDRAVERAGCLARLRMSRREGSTRTRNKRSRRLRP